MTHTKPKQGQFAPGAASKGGRTTAARMTPEERKAAGRRAYFAGAVRTVIARASDLTPEQRAAIREAIDKA